jgi:hypothetical protein
VGSQKGKFLISSSLILFFFIHNMNMFHKG